MNILALDTSSKAASCALLQGEKLVGESFNNAGLTHSQTIMPMVESMLGNVGAGLAEVDLFAVTSGPGSFTGLRIGIGAVKGMAMALGKPCAAVSTLESLAWNLPVFPGVVVPVMDARCRQVYTAAFSCDGGIPARLWEDEAISLGDLETRLRGLAPRPVVLVGDGAHLCADWAGGIPGLEICPERLRHQRASSVAAAAQHSGVTISPLELAPCYLRLPQAERERMEKQNRGGSHR